MAENGMRDKPNEDDFANGHQEHDMNSENGKLQGRFNEVARKYMQELLAERSRMENHFPHALKLIDEALERLQLNGRIPTREQYADVYQQRTIKLSQKVHVPIKDKKFNYVGKLLGPKGNSLRRLQEETQCKIVILGRFSMKDRAREEELRNSPEAKYAHLNLPLHVEVSTIAPPAEAYARIAYALAELRRYLMPDKHDDIRQEQFRELMQDPEAAKKIAIRHEQQNGQQSHNINNRNASVGSNGSYRSKFASSSQYYQQKDDTAYYRLNSTNYHQPKSYTPAVQRSNTMHSGVLQQPIISTSSGVVLNTNSYNGRGTTGSIVMANGIGIGGVAATGNNVRFRPPVAYQYFKK